VRGPEILSARHQPGAVELHHYLVTYLALRGSAGDNLDDQFRRRAICGHLFGPTRLFGPSRLFGAGVAGVVVLPREPFSSDRQLIEPSIRQEAGHSIDLPASVTA
jgi:hypothetical protein